MSLPQRLHDGDGVGLVTSSRESIGSRKEEALRSEERLDTRRGREKAGSFRGRKETRGWVRRWD